VTISGEKGYRAANDRGCSHDRETNGKREQTVKQELAHSGLRTKGLGRRYDI
jgi:hypothetical protein